MATTRKQIDDFLALKRIAVVGVSRNPKETSYALWQELRQRRYDAIPVNPATTEIDGKPCYATVRDIEPPVEGALIMTTKVEGVDLEVKSRGGHLSRDGRVALYRSVGATQP